jgi:hypothetical protein
VLLYRLEDRIYPRDVHVGGIDQMLQLDEFIPYLLLENSLGSYREALRSDEVCLFLIAKIRIGLQELLKSIPLRLEFPIVILEHTDSSPRMYNQDLTPYHHIIPFDCLGPRMIDSRCWLLLGSASEIRICPGYHCYLFVNIAEP